MDKQNTKEQKARGIIKKMMKTVHYIGKQIKSKLGYLPMGFNQWVC